MGEYMRILMHFDLPELQKPSERPTVLGFEISHALGQEIDPFCTPTSVLQVGVLIT